MPKGLTAEVGTFSHDPGTDHLVGHWDFDGRVIRVYDTYLSEAECRDLYRKGMKN